jgi:hypothetical protein
VHERCHQDLFSRRQPKHIQIEVFKSEKVVSPNVRAVFFKRLRTVERADKFYGHHRVGKGLTLRKSPRELRMEDQKALDLHNDRNVYILGAGFSVPAGLPVIANFTYRMRDAIFWLRDKGRADEA